MTEVEQDNRPAVYEDGELSKTIFRFSSLGACSRSLVCFLKGEEPSSTPEWMLEKYEEGRRAEDAILRAWAQGTWRLEDVEDMAAYRDLPYVRRAEYGQFCAEIPVGAHVLLRGKPDGIASLFAQPLGFEFALKDRVVVEAKAFGKSYWDKFVKEGLKGFPHYQAQVTLEMGATGLPCAFIVGRKVTKEEAEVNPQLTVGDFTGEWMVEYVREPPMKLGVLKAKAAKVLKLAEMADLPGCDVDQYPCPFFHMHEAKEEKPAVELEGDEATFINGWAGSWAAAAGAEKDAKGVKKRLKEELVAWKERNGLLPEETLRTGTWDVQWVESEMPEKTVKGYVMSYPKLVARKKK